MQVRDFPVGLVVKMSTSGSIIPNMQGTRRERVTKFQKKINTFWLQQHSNNLILGGKGGADSSLFMCTGVPISTLGGHLPVTHGLVVYTCPLLEAGPQPGSLTISLNAHCRNIQGNKPSLHVWQSAGWKCSLSR